MKRVELSHGGGGVESQQLIQNLFYRAFGNEILLKAEDAAVLAIEGQVAFTTDSFTVSPLFFQGGNIGKLAVAGTVNDLAMMGAKPLYLSCAFMIEEGFLWSELETIVFSMAAELKKCGTKVVCGDTKVVPKGAVDQLFINTSGIGQIIAPLHAFPSGQGLKKDDAIIVSGDIGRHGAVILAARESLNLQSDLQSDCEVLWPAIQALFNAGVDCHALRDATRGGLSALLNEWASSSQVCIEIDEDNIPIDDAVQGLCELLGFDALDFANEGTFVLSVSAKQADLALQTLQQFTFCQNATVIGRVSDFQAGLVILQSPWGSQRVLEWPKGELLPRIC